MKHKKIDIVLIPLGIIIPVVIIGVVMGVFVLRPIIVRLDDRQAEREASKKSFLAPFHEVYDAFCEKHLSIKSLREEVGAGDHYGMYYIECDIAENTDCFAEFVDIQREINALMDAEKDDEWFKEFDGHIDIRADNRRLRAFYRDGSITKEFWADNIISDEYYVLWDAFPEIDEIYLAIELTDYSDEIESAILQKNEGKNITVEPPLGS